MNNDFESACNLINIDKSNEYLEISFSKSEYKDTLENNLSNSLNHKIANIEKIDNEDEYNKTDYSNEVSYEAYKDKFEKGSLYLVTFDAEGRKFTDLYIVDENNNIITSGIMSYSFKSRYNFEQTNRTLTNNND